jgi:predicted RNase H-like HicB family nuclease
VIEKADRNYSAYAPDLPGCVATGETVQAIEAEICEAIRFHIDGLKAGCRPRLTTLQVWRLLLVGLCHD